MASNGKNTPEDDLALRNLMAKYTDAVNRCDGERWGSCWTHDATWHLMGNDIVGRDKIVGLWQQVMSGFDFALLTPNSSLFEVSADGQTASGHYYLQEHTRDKEGTTASMISRYQDEYKKEDGQWRYSKREYQVLYSGDANLNGNYTPI